MKTRRLNKIVLYYHPNDQETADLIGSVCDNVIKLVRESWGLELPRGCHIYVMTSWLSFVFQSAPWSWKILLGASFPFWSLRARRAWSYSAAWTQRYGSRVAIGIKPTRLIESSDRSFGISVFVNEDDKKVNVQHVACHELVHACSAHLALPMWLNEGIASLTVDRFLGHQTIRQESLALIKDYLPKAAPPSYRSLSRMSMQAIAYHGVRAYWLVRFLEEKQPGFLTRMFSSRSSPKSIEQEMVAALNMEQDTFWTQIDGVLAGYFSVNL